MVQQQEAAFVKRSREGVSHLLVTIRSLVANQVCHTRLILHSKRSSQAKSRTRLSPTQKASLRRIPAAPPHNVLQLQVSFSPPPSAHVFERYCCLCLGESSPVDAVATALVFFHKFFMLHSFNKHERLFVASACLFLAAKVEVRSR